jgi:predicted transcriptional regulator
MEATTKPDSAAPKEPRKRVTLWFRGDLHAEMQRAANKQSRKFSVVYERAVAEYLDRLRHSTASN